MGVFLVRNLKVRFWIKSIVSLIFYVTLILTFNRSVMVGALVYEICFFAIALYQNNNRKQLIYIWVTIGAILLLLSPEIKRQFLRESSGVSTMSTLKEYHTNNQPEKAEKLIAVMVEKTKSKEFKKMGNEYLSAKNKEEKYEILDNYFYEKTKRAAFSGRTDIWNRYIEFIKNHVWFGNGSTRLVDKHSDHAHSIYLNLMAMHGIFLFVFMFFIIFKNINSYNMAFICGILAIGVFQTVIFWGGSVIDILFYSILFYKPKSIV